MALLIRTKLAYCNVNGASVPFENQVVVNKAVASSRTNKTKQWVTFPPHPPPPPPAGAPPPSVVMVMEAINGATIRFPNNSMAVSY